MELRWYGTAAIIFTAEGQSLVFDPFFSMNPNIKKYSAEDFTVGNIFITHGHFDHLIDVPEILKAGTMKVYCSTTAGQTLHRAGVDPGRINEIGPGENLKDGPFEIKVLRGKHIRFNSKLIVKTLFNRRLFTYSANFRKLLKISSRYPPGEILVYEITCGGKKVLHLGSLNLDPGEQYPRHVDLLTLPYQGRSDLDQYSMQFVKLIEPKAVYLHHFDDTFPPVSGFVSTQGFVDRINDSFPEIKVFVPWYEEVLPVGQG